MSWYEKACSHIAEQIREHPELSHEEMRQYCSKHYPFGDRTRWPYKCWLKAMQNRFGKRQKKTSQLLMFDEDKHEVDQRMERCRRTTG